MFGKITAKGRKTALLSVLTLIALLVQIMPAVFADGSTLFSEDFDRITSASEWSGFSQNFTNSETEYAVIENGALKFGKTAGGGRTINNDFSAAVDGVDKYRVSFDFKLTTKNSSFLMYLGGGFEIQKETDETAYVIRCFDNDANSWESAYSTQKYMLNEGEKLSFLINTETDTVDLYIGTELAKANVKRRTKTVTGYFNRLQITLNNGLRGDMWIDNFEISTDMRIPGAGDDEIVSINFPSDEVITDGQSPVVITANAAATTGIKNVRFYIGENEIANLSSAPYTVDVSAWVTGDITVRAVAESQYGNTGEASVNILLRKTIGKEVFSDSDFTLKNSTTTNSGMSISQGRGYVKVDSVDEEHGDSLFIGIDTVNEAVAINNLPYVNIPVGGIENSLSVELNAYVSGMENSGQKRISLYQQSGKEVHLLRFNNKMVIGSVQADYEEGVWMPLKINIDMKKHSYTVLLNGSFLGSADFPASITKANYIRIYGPQVDSIKTYTAVDDIVIKRVFEIPAISEVGNGSAVNADDKKIEVTLSSDLYGKSISVETVELLDENGENIEIESVSYSDEDNKITVIPAKKLMSNSSYTVSIKETAKLAEDIGLESPISQNFTTAMRNTEITGVLFDTYGGKVRARVSAVNADGKTLYFVLAAYKNGEFLGKTVKKSAVNTDLLLDTYAGAKYEVYVFDGLNPPRFICNQIFSKE